MKYTDILEDPHILSAYTLHLEEDKILLKQKVENKKLYLEINVPDKTIKEVYADCWSKKLGCAFKERRVDMNTLIDPGNGKKMKTGWKRA